MLGDPGYLAVALVVAVIITVALRAVPFAVTSTMEESELIGDLGRWMPLGAIAILAVYCLSTIDTGVFPYGLPELAGVAVTAAVHLWRRNAVLSIVSGTVVCVLITNLVLPSVG